MVRVRVYRIWIKYNKLNINIMIFLNHLNSDKFYVASVCFSFINCFACQYDLPSAVCLKAIPRIPKVTSKAKRWNNKRRLKQKISKGKTQDHFNHQYGAMPSTVLEVWHFLIAPILYKPAYLRDVWDVCWLVLQHMKNGIDSSKEPKKKKKTKTKKNENNIAERAWKNE